MQSKKILYLPIVGLSILTALGVLLFDSLLTQWFEKKTQAELTSALISSVIALKNDQPIFHPAFMDPYVDANTHAREHLRITVIDQDGLVIGDSSLPTVRLSTLGNHSSRPEVVKALSEDVSSSIRYSETQGSDVIYVAKAFSYEQFSGVLRFSTPMSYINNTVTELTNILGLLMGLIVGTMAFIGYFTNRYIQQHLTAEQEQLEEHVASRTREIELLQRLANMLAACNSLNEAQQVVENIVPRILGDVNGAISIIRSSRNQLEIKLDWGGEWPAATSYSPDECWALRKGKSHLANDEFIALPCGHMEAVGDDQSLCIPLIAHGNTIGMMHLYLGKQSQLDEELMQLAFTVAEHLGLALANLNLQEKLREQAVRDPLTGLHNRRYLEESIGHELMRAKRHNQKMSVLMLDMDHFKRFNDTFGHDAGDYVLKSLATLLTNCMRSEDIVCRIGGEELAVLLPHTDAVAAVEVGGKLCEQVRDMHLKFNDTPLGKLTLSVGAATFPVDAEEADALLKLADTALYAAKSNGRDQCVHTNLPRQDQATSITVSSAAEPPQAIPCEGHTAQA